MKNIENNCNLHILQKVHGQLLGVTIKLILLKGAVHNNDTRYLHTVLPGIMARFLRQNGVVLHSKK